MKDMSEKPLKTPAEIISEMVQKEIAASA